MIQILLGRYFLFGLIVFILVSPTHAWQNLATNGLNPSPRRGVVGLYDASSNRLIFQGGETANFQFVPDTWYFDLNSRQWIRPSLREPDNRCHHTFLHDPDRNRGLLFGGFPRTNKLWSWNLSNPAWTDITPAANNPTARCLHSAVMCLKRNEMIVYGGLNGGFTPDLKDTWSYDLKQDQWTQLVQDSLPGFRYGHVAALDEKRDRMIVFGGFSRFGNSSPLDADDLWQFDLSSRTWSQLTSTLPGPSARQFARGVSLPDGTGMIIFGGQSNGVFKNDLWFLNYADLSWKELTLLQTPPEPRYRHTLILDSIGNRLWVAFGEGSAGEHYSDVWELSLDGILPGPTMRLWGLHSFGQVIKVPLLKN